MKLVKFVPFVFAAITLTACGTSEKEISKSDFDGEWPFTVDSGVVKCINDGSAKLAIFVNSGTEYQLNGSAKSRGYTDIMPIWKDNPDIQGAKVNISPVIDIALTLCN